PFLHRQFELATATPERRSWLTAPVLAVRARYAAIVHNHWFPRVIVSVFVLQAVGVVLSVVYSLVIAAGAAVGSGDAMNELNETLRAGPILWTTLAATLISGAFSVIGLARLSRSRRPSYPAFRTSGLLSLFPPI